LASIYCNGQQKVKFSLKVFKITTSEVEQVKTKGGLTIVPRRQLLRGLFFDNLTHFKYIFREIGAFLEISVLCEDIFREIKAFLNYVRLF
jgi:hypothetical protein